MELQFYLRIDPAPRLSTDAKQRMNSNPRIETLLDEWEERLEQVPNASLEQFLNDRCIGESDSVIAILREKANRLVSIDQKLEAVLNTKSSFGIRDTSCGLRIQDLQVGTEPVPGYTLVARLGSGGFGEVWKAAGPGGFHVALKFVPLNGRVGETELRALNVIREIRHANLLSHFGTWTIGNLLIIATELADRTLLDRLQESQAFGNRGIPRDELLQYMDEAAKGIDFLNEPTTSGRLQIQHRDIKPQNLLLSGGSVKVGDFGLARSLESDATGHTGSMTMAYAAPECFDGTTSFRSDQYSLAVTYCYLRGGELPFDGTPFEVMDGHRNKPPNLSMLPAEEHLAVARALAKPPNDRWPSSTAFVQSLRSANAETGRPIIPSPVPSWLSYQKSHIWSAFALASIGIAIGVWNTLDFSSPKIPSQSSQPGITPGNSNVVVKASADDERTAAAEPAKVDKKEPADDQPRRSVAPVDKRDRRPKTLDDDKTLVDEIVTSDDAAEFLSNPK